MSAKERMRATKSIARIAARHNLDGDELLECIREAWDKGDSRCGDLTITCRKKTAKVAVFLFEDDKVLYQFSIPVRVLRRPERVVAGVRSIDLR